MRIGVVSDTHLRRGERLPADLINGLRHVDMILHAGDLTDMTVIAQFENIAPVRAVAGNMDNQRVHDCCPTASSAGCGASSTPST